MALKSFLPVSQLALSLPPVPVFTRESYFVSDANREAHGWIEAWPSWPAHGLILSGPHSSGKTHLARIWQETAGAAEVFPSEVREQPAQSLLARAPHLLLEHFEETGGDETLLHLLNAAREQKACLLLTTRLSAGEWPFRLPDLTSRLAALPRASLTPPDDQLLAAVLTKLFSDRQLRAPHEVVEWLVTRIERSLLSAQECVECLDRAALDHGRRISLPLAQKLYRP